MCVSKRLAMRQCQNKMGQFVGSSCTWYIKSKDNIITQISAFITTERLNLAKHKYVGSTCNSAY